MKKLSTLFLFCCTQFFASAQWTQLNSGTNYDLVDVCFFNNDTGLAVGYDFGGHGIVIKTTNGGLSWNSIDYASTHKVYSMSFPGNQVGYICGDGFIKKTTDGGDTWTSLAGGNQFFWQIQFVNDTVGYVNDIDAGKLKKTVDGGQTWTSLPYPFITLNRFYFSSADTGMATVYSSSYENETNKTFDGGITWTVSLSGGASNGFGCISHIENQRWFTVRSDDTAIYAEVTNDDGQIWTDSLMDSVPVQHYLSRNCVAFPTPTVGWLGGLKYIANSFDGGDTWTVNDSVPSGGPDSLFALSFPNPQIGYAVGASGLIMKYMQSASCAANFSLVADTLIPHHYWGVNTSTGTLPLNYYWSWGDGSYDSTAYPSHTYASEGFYNICLTIQDSTGCIDNMCIDYAIQKVSDEEGVNTIVTVDIVPDLPTATQNVESPMQLSVFPNPVQTQLFVNLTSPANEVTVRVYDLQGRMILLPITFENAQAQLNTSSLADGFYTLQIINNKTGESKVGKFVKE